MEEQEIEVRNLSGESITISISPTKTVADFKLILKQRFLPPSSSSDFHLFLRGKKLGVQSQIGSHTIYSGEFIALIPFTKKGKSQNLQPEESEVIVQTKESAPSNLAESAWRDMVEDLSYLSNKITSEEQPSCSPNCWSDGSKGDMTGNTGRKRRKKSQAESNVGLAEDLISSLLHSSGKHVLDENVCEIILKVLESVHCLSDAETGNCMLLSKVDIQENGHMAQPSCSCCCPTWLTMMMKTFTFLNVLAGYLQMRCEILSFDLVKELLGKLHELGFCATVNDLKYLSDLFPKVVQFIDQEAESSKLSLDVIVINNSIEKADLQKSYVKAQKATPMSKIFSSIKRRQTVFRITLQECLKLLVPHGNYQKITSLEQFVTSVKKADPSSSGTAVVKCRSRIEAQCCVCSSSSLSITTLEEIFVAMLSLINNFIKFTGQGLF